MEQHIDVQVLLLASEKIRQLGRRFDERYVYDQVAMELSYDGYTVVLRQGNNSITLMFHNKVKVDYVKMHELEAFYQRIKKISQTDVSLMREST